MFRLQTQKYTNIVKYCENNLPLQKPSRQFHYNILYKNCLMPSVLLQQPAIIKHHLLHNTIKVICTISAFLHHRSLSYSRKIILNMQ